MCAEHRMTQCATSGDDAEAVVLGGKRTRDEPAEAGRSVQRRKTGENAELAVDDDEASQWKTAKLKEEMDDGEDEKPNARPPDDDKPAAPKPAAFSIDLQEEARREPSFAPTFTHAALYVGQKRAPLVKSGGFVLNVALPCYAEYPEQPGDAQQRHSKRFKKQEIGGGASIVQLEVYKDAVAPMVELSQLGQGDPDQMIRYDDLISVRPEAVRRRAGGKFSGLLPSGRGSALLHNVDILPPSSRADGLRTAVPPAAASAAPARGRAQAGSKKSAGALKLHKNSAGAIDPFDYPSDDD
ncbi:hypothetical protein DIPPA_16110 [Diplonema papillatum]|nr:hypothetical protein DIPPA_16110 [Diplonema papillatum]